MSVAQQAIAARRKSRRDVRYIGQGRKDATKRAEREKLKAIHERERKMRRKK